MVKATQNKKDVEDTKNNVEPTAVKDASESAQKQRVIKHPNDVAALALSQLNAINTKKDELTIAIKGLSDLTTQLVNVYASNMNTIQQMQARIKELEEKNNSKK